MNGHEIAAWMVNAVIAITLIEGVLFILLRKWRAKGPAPADIVCNLAAGLCLLGALRSEIAGMGGLVCAAWLATAGVSHAFDVWRRWPGSPRTAKRRHADSLSKTFHLGTKRQS
jgi:hypothetical protein